MSTAWTPTYHTLDPYPRYEPPIPVDLMQPEVHVGATAIPAIPTFWWFLSAASAGVSAYHGYRRNNSIPWAVGWGVLGGMFPIIVPAIAFAQGFGKRA